MPATLPTVNLTGSTVGQSGTISLTPIAGQAGISYATFGQATLRLHNESACGLQCMLDASGQSFYLPAGGWLDCYPTGGDNALNFTILYILNNPGVSLVLATYYAPGETVPAMPILGNSPVGVGGTVSTSFTELTNTGNAPGNPIINVQPNDATSPTWFADNSGNFTISGDNAGILTQLLRLIAGASPEVLLAASGVLTQINGSMRVLQAMAVGTTVNNAISLFVRPMGTNEPALVVAGLSGQITNPLEIQDNTFTNQFWIDANGDTNALNSVNIGTGSVTTLTGSAGGTATLYQPFAGSGYKKCLLYLNNFRTQITAQFLPIPVPFTTNVFITSGDIASGVGVGGLSFELSNSLRTLEIPTTFAVGGGNLNAETVLFGMSFATCASGIDMIVFNPSGTASTGLVIMEGI